MHSLTSGEKRALQKATERQRQRELETGRARWRTIGGVALSPGPGIGGGVRWEPEKAGTLRATLRLDGGTGLPLLSGPVQI